MDKELLGLAELTTPKNLRAYAAEFLGTLLFVLMGTGAVIAATAVGGANDSSALLVVIAMAHGLGIGMMVYLTANVSGGHINPAVTVGMMVTKRIKIAPGAAYIVAQMLGGVMATVLLYVIVKNGAGNISDFGAHEINKAIVGNGGALLLEAILTAVLVMVIFAVAVSKKGYGNVAPLVIGLTIMLIHLVAVFMTGASVNPARTFGPALVSNAFDSFWVYLLGPAIGAAAGALLYQNVFLAHEEDAA